jgi:hypothetical protein
MIMYLNDVKVARCFGSRPDLGRVIGGMSPSKRVTVGVRWSLPRKVYEPDDNVIVRCAVALICKGKGKWEVKCDPRHTEFVREYLMGRCY